MAKAKNISTALQRLAVPVSSLHEDPKNARTHSDHNIQAIKNSLEMFGQQKPIVVVEDGTVIAGNGTLRAAKNLGWKEIAAVKFDGGDRTKALAYAIADNRSAELALWDGEKLRTMLKDLEKNGIDLESLAFGKKELDGVLNELGHRGQEIIEDEVPEVPEVPVSKLGDLWLLGGHRLLCGDATKTEDVEKVLNGEKPSLMVTDPPYGTNYDPEWRRRIRGVTHKTKKMGLVANDDQADWTPAWRLFPGDVAYVWHAGNKASIVEKSLSSCGLLPRAQIIWAKDRLALSRGDYHWQHEPCWYMVREGKKSMRTADRTQTTLWKIPTHMAEENTTLWVIPAREDDGHGHGTQKPVECMARPIRNHLFELVYDPFLGSGTTVIAAEQLSRRCFGIEIEPQYCDVIVKRWQIFTKKSAENATRPKAVVAT
jgi:DNA modification methylase